MNSQVFYTKKCIRKLLCTFILVSVLPLICHIVVFSLTQVLVSEGEESSGLVLHPLELPLSMVNHPPSPDTTLLFRQYLAPLSGSITCLGKLFVVTL